MTTEKQNHTESSWEEPFDCDYYATKGPDILRVDNLEHARKCVLACAGLNPEAVPGLVEALEYFSRCGGNISHVACVALAAAKIEGE